MVHAMKPRARTEKQADDAAGFEQGTIGRVTLSMGVAVAQEVESLDCPSAGGPLLRSQRAQDGRIVFPRSTIWSRKSAHVRAAVEGEVRAGRECSVVRGEPRNDGGALCGLAETLHGNRGDDALEYVRADSREHFGL